MTTIEFSNSIAELRPILRTFTYRFTSDREECQDLVQDTILKALIYRDKVPWYRRGMSVRVVPCGSY